MRWGVTLEWDEGGLECCKWHEVGAGPRAFDTKAGAEAHIETLERANWYWRRDIDVIFTARQFA